ncbi:ChaB1 [Buzura suppressaria nucleopolyhedrovirus]|uniref:ChaB1 n=1 Tax=Buzura suppressaria nuclear polyhedrosis virus TaxID=74320 RepID=W5VKJ0_NPVBS|nr:ChaB1 [Buzura suppressaria nucleopolyhedrovirus]AHH82628.1 ChaB1 [Buzura suppressaria nucleopolyhedrovirus]
MDYLANVQFKNELPGRAKRLYMNIFRRYHKLNGGDENVAMYLAQKEVEKHYVKLNNQWLPKEAVRLIVRHNMSSSDDDSDSDTKNKKRKLIGENATTNAKNINYKNSNESQFDRSESIESDDENYRDDGSDDDDDDDDDDDVIGDQNDNEQESAHITFSKPSPVRRFRQRVRYF